jgi:hypothetical protein
MVLAGDRPKATLHELQTVYGLRDLYDLIEVVLVENHNDRTIARHREREARRPRQE